MRPSRRLALFLIPWLISFGLFSAYPIFFSLGVGFAEFNPFKGGLTGWVGLDKSLGLMAEMPIPPKWLSAHGVLDAALRNQTIQVPITGTLQRPIPDRDVLAQLSRRFLRNAARNLLEDGLNQGFDRLFGPRE